MPPTFSLGRVISTEITSDAAIVVAEVSSKGELETAITASEAAVVDAEPEAATAAPEVDGYAVYVPASDSAPVSEAMPLAA